MSDNREYRSRRFAQLVGLELKGEFAKHSISQTKVAEILGHSKGGYSKWINAKPSMPLEAFLNTCELIEADPKRLLTPRIKGCSMNLVHQMNTASAKTRSPMISSTVSPRTPKTTTWPRTRIRTHVSKPRRLTSEGNDNGFQGQSQDQPGQERPGEYR